MVVTVAMTVAVRVRTTVAGDLRVIRLTHGDCHPAQATSFRSTRRMRQSPDARVFLNVLHLAPPVILGLLADKRKIPRSFMGRGRNDSEFHEEAAETAVLLSMTGRVRRASWDSCVERVDLDRGLRVSM